jgi:FHS family L-fucose permease-like MFS transporter
VAFAGYVNALAYGIGMCIDKERRKNIDAKTGKKRLDEMGKDSVDADEASLEKNEKEVTGEVVH